MKIHHTRERHETRGAILLFSFSCIMLLCLVVVTGNGVVEEVTASSTRSIEEGTFRDYMRSFAFVIKNPRCPWFHTNEYVRVRLHAYRSFQRGPEEVGMPDDEVTHISIFRSVMINALPHNTTLIRNITLDDEYSHEYSLERMNVGTYQYKAIITYEGNHKIEEGGSVEVRHPPLKYVLKTQDHEGRYIKFIPKDKGTFTITVRRSLNTLGEETEVYNVTGKKTFHISGENVILVRITVKDRYGWVNDLEDGKDFVQVYKDPDFYPYVPITLALMIVIIIVLMWFMYRRSEHRRIKRKEGYSL